MQLFILRTATYVYKVLLKRIFFLFPAELVHTVITSIGEAGGRIPFVVNSLKTICVKPFPRLRQSVANMSFATPIGLAAGFDYEAKCTQILPAVGFGYGTVGTITNMPYEGNIPPRLARLPKSKSLLVNKGFKNAGAKAIAAKLSSYTFAMPVGISIGITNTKKLTTLDDGIADIIKAFKTFEKSNIKHSYYELNISCPNLHTAISFYPPANLHKLLTAIKKAKISRPIFIKMPIEKSDAEVKKMLTVIIKFQITGVIFGNLQKDRKNAAFDKNEMKKFVRYRGHFSGRPTFQRSNELIKLAYETVGDKLVIIGCGGIFSAEDAYIKIKLGASLLQLITGMIYHGPFFIAQLNHELEDLLKRDGYTSLAQAVGTATKKGARLSKKRKMLYS